MEAVEIYKDIVWSVKYEGEDKDIFSLKMKQWLDVEYVDKFIHDHRKFIQNYDFWAGYTYQEIVTETVQEARQLIKDFSKYYWNTIYGKHPDLRDKFVILERSAFSFEAEQRRKLYGKRAKSDTPSVLRLYALKLEPDSEDSPPAFLITGGGIKLASRMEQMKELQEEYRKILSVQQWLENNGVRYRQDIYKLTVGK